MATTHTHYYGSYNSACGKGCSSTNYNSSSKDCPLYATKSSRYIESTDCSEDEYDEFGGILNTGLEFSCQQNEKCGFFRRKKDSTGRWWLVNPLNNPFFSAGLDSIYPDTEENLNNNFPGGLGEWAMSVYEKLVEVGVNTMGCWSHYKEFQSVGAMMPYTVRLNLAQHYKHQGGDLDNYSETGAVPVFNDDFESVITEYAKTTVESEGCKDDPFLLGYFTDNELPLYPGGSRGDLTLRYLRLGTGSQGFLWLRNWLLTERHPDSGLSPHETDPDKLYALVSDWDEFHFTYEVSFRYYSAAVKAVRAADPNHLNLGSRLHGAAKSNKFIARAAKDADLDVLSFNFYCKHDPLDTPLHDEFADYASWLEMWEDEGPGPSMITEFYVKGKDAGERNGAGEGLTVRDQTERGRWFQFFATQSLKVNGIVGLHWFKYQDGLYKDSTTGQMERSNQGVVDGDYEWYQALGDSFQVVFKHIRHLV